VPEQSPENSGSSSRLRAFRSELVERIRKSGGALDLPAGQIALPKVFGFCRGVERALEMLDDALTSPREGGKRVFLLGQIIHNPWVNDYLANRGVQVLTPEQRNDPERSVTCEDCAVIPAFGVPLEVQRRLEKIGCPIVDTSCGDVRRVWKWAEQAAAQGYGVLIFGRALHDETVVTKSRLAATGGKYVVAGDLDEVRRFAELISGDVPPERFRELFPPRATNAERLDAFERVAQVSQTTMLYNDTMKVRQILREAFIRRFGGDDLEERLKFQRTVCRATQDRQSAAVDLCRRGCDLAIVVGGFTSSNTRHLFELAGSYCPAYFIESADAIRSRDEIQTYDFRRDEPIVVREWFPRKRPLRIAVLSGASTPEIVIGQVIEKLAKYLSDACERE
jgi:4-hydroxy-3-methylbut-2-enyl diphosphate reductase